MAIADFKNARLISLTCTVLSTLDACLNCITNKPTIESLQYVSNILSMLLSDEPPRTPHFQQISATDAPQYIAEKAIYGALAGLTIYGLFAVLPTVAYNILYDNDEGMPRPDPVTESLKVKVE